MKSKLILVEGLPSSGKSTTSRIVHEKLDDFRINNQLIYEGILDHPADYDGEAFFTIEQFNDLIKLFKDEKEYINKIAIKNEEGYFIQYKKRIKKYKEDIPKELLEEVIKNDVYELPLEIHMELIKNKWRQFVSTVKNQEKIYVFDCSFIQNPVTITMIRDNVKKDVIINYIEEIQEIIKELNPILIYIEQKDIEKSFKRVIYQRPKEWLDFFITYYTKQGYGKKHSLEGLKGTIEVLKARQIIEKDIFELLDIEKYIVDNSNLDLEKHTINIENILKNLS